MIKNRITRSNLLLVFFLLTISHVFAQPRFDSGRLDHLINKSISDKMLHGAVILTGTNNEISFFKTYGYSNLEGKIPMQKDVIFRIASMTKIITCVGLMTLYEDGRILLTDPVSDYIPSFRNMRVITNVKRSGNNFEFDTKPVQNEIRIMDLLLHTSGIGYGFYGGPLDKNYKEADFAHWEGTLEEFSERMAKEPLLFEPGTQWQYGYSSDILGRVIEVVSGMPLNQFLKERIFDPLGMNDTGFYVPKEKLPRLCNHYRFQNGELKLEENIENTRFKKLPNACSGGGGWYDGYGGIVTTATDFATFLQMVLNYGEYNGTRILSRNTVEYMFKDHISKIEKKSFLQTGYGIGAGVTGTNDSELSTPGDIYWAGGPYNTHFYLSFKKNMFGIMLVQNAPFGILGLMDKFDVILQSSWNR